MKKFQIETLFIVLGMLLVLSTTGKQCWEQVVCVANCTQGCGTPQSTCTNSNVTACDSLTGLSNCGASCSSNYTGKTYRNTPVHGTSSGTSKISYTPETCVVTIPCVAGIAHYGQKCQIEALGITLCHSITAVATDVCYSCSPGTSTTTYIYNCSTLSCTEE
jgi:hypothetical protein